MVKKSDPGLVRVGALLRAARDAIGASRATAAKWAGVAEGTVQNWEDAATPSALRLALYMKHLAGRSDLAREFVLQILGMGDGVVEVEPELARRIQLVKQSYEKGVDNMAVRRMWDAMEEVMRALDPPQAASGDK